jgi:hypothetical protein
MHRKSVAGSGGVERVLPEIAPGTPQALRPMENGAEQLTAVLLPPIPLQVQW